MLFNALYRLKLYSLVSVLNPKSIIVFKFAICLAYKIDGFAAELGHHVVNGILVCIKTQYLDLQVNMILLVAF